MKKRDKSGQILKKYLLFLSLFMIIIIIRIEISHYGVLFSALSQKRYTLHY